VAAEERGRRLKRLVVWSGSSGAEPSFGAIGALERRALDDASGILG